MSDSPRRVHIAELADACVKCGLCLPYCPTYALDSVETESPRGRITLARHGTDGSLAPGHELRLHLDHCLGCMACQRVCPVPVQYAELLTEYRAELPPADARPRRMLRLLTRPAWLRFGASLARWTAARHWLPPLSRALPKASPLRAMISLLPALPTPARVAADDARPGTSARGRVALFGGCVQGVFECDAQDAATGLLAAAGYQVVRIDGSCCGALAAHTGDSTYADALAGRARETFVASGAETLLSATSGCLGTLRAALPQARVQDAMAFLDAHGDTLRFRPLAQRAVLHLPCTQVNVSRADGAVKRLLGRIPGLELHVLPTQGMCCGAAGSHMLEFPERAAELRERIFATMPQPMPDLLLTSNIGCRLHLGAGLHEQGARVTIEHPISLLASALCAVPARESGQSRRP